MKKTGAKVPTLILIILVLAAVLYFAVIKPRTHSQPLKDSVEQNHAGHKDDHGHEGHDHGGGEAEKPKGGLNLSEIKTVRAVTGQGWDVVTATGKVVLPPGGLVKVSPRIEGKIEKIFVTMGDSIKKGQPVAIISSIALAEARAEYRQAAASLDMAGQNYRKEAQLAKLGAFRARPLEEARIDYLEAQGNLEDVRNELSKARSELVKCTARLERSRELYNEQIVSKQDMESSEAEFKTDQARALQLEAQLEKAKVRVEVAREYYRREEKIHGSRLLDTRSMLAAEGELTQAEIRLQAARDKISIIGGDPEEQGDTLTLTAPLSGRIASRDKNVGELASPSDSIVAIANLSQVWIEADVNEKDLSSVKIGQKAEIKVASSLNRSFEGRVLSIGDILNPDSRSAKVIFRVDNAGGVLKGEMSATVSIHSNKRESVVMIPKQAVLNESGRQIVFSPCADCEEDIKAGKSVCGAYDKIEVATGPAHGESVEILSGLKGGDLVVTVGQYQIMSAQNSGQLKAGCTDH